MPFETKEARARREAASMKTWHRGASVVPARRAQPAKRRSK
jgi:hypothetical protein